MGKTLFVNILTLTVVGFGFSFASAENLSIEERAPAYDDSYGVEEHSSEHVAADEHEDADDSEATVVNPQAPHKYIFGLPVDTSFIWGGHFGPRLVGSLKDADRLFNLRSKNPEDTTPVMLKARGRKERKRVATQFHIGTDFRVPKGTPVTAVHKGTVYALGYMTCPGYTLAIKHEIPGAPQPIYSVYKHLNGFDTKIITGTDGKKRIKKSREVLARGETEKTLAVGDTVEAGDELALSGASGMKMRIVKGVKMGCVAGAHLHFEVRLPKSESENDVLNQTVEHTRVFKKRIYSQRLELINTLTAAVNPADYIEAVDQACFVKKKIEIQNALAVEAVHPGRLPPISAGLCSENSEKLLKAEFDIFPVSYQSLWQSVSQAF